MDYCLNQAKQIYNNNCNEDSINPYLCNRDNIKKTATQKYNYHLCLYSKLYKAYMTCKNSNDSKAKEHAKELYYHVKELNNEINKIAKNYYHNYIVKDINVSSKLSNNINVDSLTISNNNKLLEKQNKYLNENVYLNPEIDKRISDVNSSYIYVNNKYNIILIINIIIILIIVLLLIINSSKKI